jgi:hypothetical protein
MKRIHLPARHVEAPVDVDAPRSTDMVFEIGLTLALHLALALAVVVTLGACGIA